MFYKIVENGQIAQIGSPNMPNGAIEITEEKYNQLMAVIRNHPSDTLETKHYLSAETETYVGRETTHEEKTDWYAAAVLSEEMTIDDVPEEFKEEVLARLPKPDVAAHTLDEYADLLSKEVSA
nr:MAG TPA: hypothetical protein [Caudoviricetes sp.]